MKYPRAVTAIVTFCILLLSTGYCSAYLGSFSADGLHNALGATGGLLIGISLGLGPLSGRIAAARRLLRLRKTFGLTG